MAYDILKKRIEYNSHAAPDQSSRNRLIGKGMTASLSNPYWFVWWATVGLALLVKSQELGLVGPVVFYFGHILSDFVWYTAVSILIWKGRKLVAGTGLRILILSCALFLVYLGTSFVYDGVTGAV